MAALLLAVALDLALGEPPDRWHPVALNHRQEREAVSERLADTLEAALDRGALARLLGR